MPGFHGISTHLESQYDIRHIQEYFVPSQAYSSGTDNHGRGATQLSAVFTSIFKANGSSHTAKAEASVQASVKKARAKSSVIDVHVPIYANSQFWLAYRIDPKLLALPQTLSVMPASHATDAEINYVYFKLILYQCFDDSVRNSEDDGKRIISWGVGAKDDWKGKTMFGLFRTRQDWTDRSRVDKKGFWFSHDGVKEGYFDVQIFRARKRRRIHRVFPEVKLKGSEGSEVKLVNVGRLKEHMPQRYYQYALIDPVDEPYVTFRYHLRSMGNLRAENIIPPQLHNLMTPRRYNPTEEEEQQQQQQQQQQQEARPHFTYEGIEGMPIRDCNEDEAVEAEQRKLALSDGIHQQKIDCSVTVRRLSVPPSIRVVSNTSSNDQQSAITKYSTKEPARSPLASSFSSSDSSRSTNNFNEEAESGGTGPNYSIHLSPESRRKAIQDWREGLDPARDGPVRTPSPDIAEQSKENINTPPSSSNRIGRGRFLRDVLESALRRKGSVTPPGDKGVEAEDEETGTGCTYAAVRESV